MRICERCYYSAPATRIVAVQDCFFAMHYMDVRVHVVRRTFDHRQAQLTVRNRMCTVIVSNEDSEFRRFGATDINYIQRYEFEMANKYI